MAAASTNLLALICCATIPCWAIAASGSAGAADAAAAAALTLPCVCY